MLLKFYLDRVIHFDRSDALTIDHDIVRATTDLRSDCLMRSMILDLCGADRSGSQRIESCWPERIVCDLYIRISSAHG